MPGARRGVCTGGFFTFGNQTEFSGRGGYCEDIPCRQAWEQICSDIQAPLGENAADGRGGIGTSNVQEYFAAGASFAGIGSGIFLKEDILNENEEGIRGSIAAMEEK